MKSLVLTALVSFKDYGVTADVVKQLNEVLKNNGTFREFTGSTANMFAPIYEYGCWCYLDPASDYRTKAHARPVDEIDEHCKTLISWQ